MRIITLTSGSGWHVQDLQRASAKLGVTVQPAMWRHLRGSVGIGQTVAQCNDLVLDESDAILLRTMPAGSLEQLVFRMDLLHRVATAGVPVFNSPRAVEIAVDKYLALSLMAHAGIPVPPTIVCQRGAEAQRAFVELGGDVVLKPLFGSEGFGIMRLADAQLAERAFATLERLGHVLYLQQFVPHPGCDCRLFVLGDRVLTAMRRTSDSWRTNIACGGRGEPITPSSAMIRLALDAARACATSIAGVDIIERTDGELFVIEVNAVPGWRELSRVTGVDVAAEVLQWVRQQISQSEHA